MLKIDAIVINRAEGLHSECGERFFTSLKSAEAFLREAAHTCPKNGGYNKCDFKVVFSDGETYEGRIDLEYKHAISGYSIVAHIEDYLTFLAGERQPAWMSDALWAKSKARNAKDFPGAKDYLAKYMPVLKGENAQQDFLDWMGV